MTLRVSGSGYSAMIAWVGGKSLHVTKTWISYQRLSSIYFTSNRTIFYGGIAELFHTHGLTRRQAIHMQTAKGIAWPIVALNDRAETQALGVAASTGATTSVRESTGSYSSPPNQLQLLRFTVTSHTHLEIDSSH